MKRFIITLIFALSVATLFAQEMYISPDTAFEKQSLNWTFVGVIYVDSTASKESLYQRSRQWFSENFKDSKSVIDNSDKEDGIIFGKGSISMGRSEDGFVNFKIEIRCKQGRIRYVIKDFYHKDACLLSALGTCVVGANAKILDYGSLTQYEAPYSYAKSGRNKDKFWNFVKNRCKVMTYNMIKSLNTYMKTYVPEEKESW